MSALVLAPISLGIYTALNVAAVTALASGPYDTEVPKVAAFPYVWFIVREENARGLGRGGLRRISVRVHAAATGSASLTPAKQLQGILGAAVNALEDARLTLDGATQGGEVFYSDTTEPVLSEINRSSCWEAVANFYLFAESSENAVPFIDDGWVQV